MKLNKTDTSEALKNVMRQLPFPVTVVTTAVGKEKRGITIGSFTSLSLDPTLISFNIDHSSQMHPLLTRATHFAVHILGSGQTKPCNHFSISGLSSSEQFEGISHRRTGYGTPVLEDALAVIQCRSYTQFEAGDHSIIVGEVLGVDQPKEEAGVLYYNRSYHTVGEPIQD